LNGNNKLFLLLEGFKVGKFFKVGFIPAKLSFPRKWESSIFNDFMDFRFHGNDIFKNFPLLNLEGRRLG